MRRISQFAGAALIAALLVPAARAADGKSKEGETCGEYGTTVHFEKTPKDAATKAQKEEKLVCILHVSGDFENPDFT